MSPQDEPTVRAKRLPCAAKGSIAGLRRSEAVRPSQESQRVSLRNMDVGIVGEVSGEPRRWVVFPNPFSPITCTTDRGNARCRNASPQSTTASAVRSAAVSSPNGFRRRFRWEKGKVINQHLRQRWTTDSTRYCICNGSRKQCSGIVTAEELTENAISEIQATHFGSQPTPHAADQCGGIAGFVAVLGRRMRRAVILSSPRPITASCCF